MLLLDLKLINKVNACTAHLFVAERKFLQLDFWGEANSFAFCKVLHIHVVG